MASPSTPDPDEAAWLAAMQAGQRAFRQGNLRAAADAFGRATQLQPAKMEAWTNLGSTLLEAGAFGPSADALERAITLAPAAMTPHMLLGDALRLQGRATESLRAYERAVQIERSPMALNKLACALRSRRKTEPARALYREALEIEPGFAIARVNYATLLLECGERAESERLLHALQAERLPPPLQAEVTGALLSVEEYRRLLPGIAAMNDHDDLAPLRGLLLELPEALTTVDERALATSRAYCQRVRERPAPESLPLIALPGEWPLIEALFMIPLIESVADWHQAAPQFEHGAPLSGELLESANMRDAILAARLSRDNLVDPAGIEAHLRHWHSLSTRGLDNFSPGHFKYTQNWSGKSPTLKRSEPALSSATLQYFLRELYPAAPAGLARAALCFMALMDLHCFDDGNGRVALTWINRELEWQGEMPLLFTRELGMQGRLGEAKSRARAGGGDPEPVIEVMQEAQRFAYAFCEELKRH